jgi:hypothetical protein
MRRTLLNIGLAATILLSTIGIGGNQVLAISGCCKERPPGGAWFSNGKSFDECTALNQADGDNVLDQSGRYWWDVNC